MSVTLHISSTSAMLLSISSSRVRGLVLFITFWATFYDSRLTAPVFSILVGYCEKSCLLSCCSSFRSSTGLFLHVSIFLAAKSLRNSPCRLSVCCLSRMNACLRTSGGVSSVNLIGLRPSQVWRVWSEFIMETLVEVMWKPDLVRLFCDMALVLGVCMLGFELRALIALLPWRD